MIEQLGGDEGRAALAIFSLLVPAGLYVLGLMEGRAGFLCLCAAVAVHGAVLVLRGLEIGALPLTEKHDTISFMALSTALCYRYFDRKLGRSSLGLLALPLVALLLVAASLYAPVNAVSPFQRTPWYFLHVCFFFLSYGFFGLSFCLGLLSVMRKEGTSERLQYQTAVYGWVLYSISLVAGSIWFFVSHGMYWLWTSKELWITLVWFHFGLYLHARLMRRFRGTAAALLGSAGYAVALFAYFGVGTVIPSPPTQF